MTKKLFYQHIHQEIASQYHATPFIIEYVRSCHQWLQLDRLQMAERQQNKLDHLLRIGHAVTKHLERRKEKTPEWVKKYPQTAQRTMEKLNNCYLVLSGLKRSQEKRRNIASFLLGINDNDFMNVTRPIRYDEQN